MISWDFGLGLTGWCTLKLNEVILKNKIHASENTLTTSSMHPSSNTDPYMWLGAGYAWDSRSPREHEEAGRRFLRRPPSQRQTAKRRNGFGKFHLWGNNNLNLFSRGAFCMKEESIRSNLSNCANYYCFLAAHGMESRNPLSRLPKTQNGVHHFSKER